MMLDLGAGYRLRPAREGDHSALLHVCLKTGADGQDASASEDDPDLLGLIFAVPYQVLEPDFAFVLDGPNGVCGYVLGALDTAAFNRRYLDEWLLPLRQKVRDPGPNRRAWRGSDWGRWLVHHIDLDIPEVLRPYPSHGHIDLLPEAQGRGFGRRMLETLMETLRAAGSPGFHLQVSRKNTNALAFYTRVGLVALPPAPNNPNTLMSRSFR